MSSEIENRLMNLSIETSDLYVELYLADQINAEVFGVRLLSASINATLHFSNVFMSESDEELLFINLEILKELRIIFISLQLIDQSNILKEDVKAKKLIKDCDQLVNIFQKMVTTLRKKLKRTLTINN